MKLFLFVTTLLTCSITEAQTLTTDLMLVPDKQEKRIHEGDMSIGGGINFGYASYSGFLMNGSPSFEYFLMDRLSLGASVPFNFSKSYSSIGIGPSISYYFWEGEKWAAYVNQKILVSNGRHQEVNETYIDGVSAIGSQYFFTPNVALGAELSTNYALDNKDQYSSDSMNVRFSLEFFF